MARFLYSCSECNGPVKKEPLVAQRDWKTTEPKDFNGLGGWRCLGRCRGHIKVRRVMNKQKEDAK